MTVTILVLIILASLVVIYLKRFRKQPAGNFIPAAAWTRAGIYFCACYLAAIATGTFDVLLSTPAATREQLDSTEWRLWVVGLVLLVTVAYWVVWARYTLRFDRHLDVLPQAAFGLLWGTASGLLFLSIYRSAGVIGRSWSSWQVWLLAYLLIALWQWIWQDYYWDVYISPEHDTAFSIKLKVAATHIPNITACLVFLAIYENYLIFVALQTWALLGASLAMRMPAPWSRDATPPATRSPGLFGLERASGYISPDPQTDPYMKAAHLTR